MTEAAAMHVDVASPLTSVCIGKCCKPLGRLAASTDSHTEEKESENYKATQRTVGVIAT
jgi:hypothetical protein